MGTTSWAINGQAANLEEGVGGKDVDERCRSWGEVMMVVIVGGRGRLGGRNESGAVRAGSGI